MGAFPSPASENRSAAWFCGDGAVTGVGSLPFVDAARAIDFVARHAPEVPFWPQLRRLSPREAAIPQVLGPAFKHVVVVRGEYAFHVPADRMDRFAAALARDDAKLEPGNAAGFYAFLDAFARGAFPEARAAKGQIMGPVTTASALESGGHSLLQDVEMRRVIAEHVARMANSQAEALLRVAPSAILVLDEAYLGVALRARPELRPAMVELLRLVVLRVRRPGLLVGLHCCDELPFSVLNEIAPDVFSFDAHHGGAVFAADPDARRFVAEGGHVAWGWVPTRDDLRGVDAAGVADRWWSVAQRMVEAGDDIDIARIRCRSLVTASCGLAGSSEATCEHSFTLAREVARRFVERADT
ncbi:MAG TPA: hypothetical protein VEC56_12985 [Candidatus Krumholzibacteria bacterium]|nr:hypothetical protein [Candidatus Krumholzibacteria bacterium]